MQLNVNDEKKEYSQRELSIADLLEIEKVAQPDMVSVQYNETFLRQNEYKTTNLKEGDAINFLYFMGGGK
jgi:sulfur carrier protein